MQKLTEAECAQIRKMNEAAAKKNLKEDDTGTLKMGGGEIGSLSYIGKLPGASYSDLVAVFGEPQTRFEEGGKTTVEWNGRVGQRPFVIYDYKSDKKAEDNTDWHIGGIPNRGATNDVADAVVAYFNEKKVEPVKESTDDEVTKELDAVQKQMDVMRDKTPVAKMSDAEYAEFNKLAAKSTELKNKLFKTTKMTESDRDWSKANLKVGTKIKYVLKGKDLGKTGVIKAVGEVGPTKDKAYLIRFDNGVTQNAYPYAVAPIEESKCRMTSKDDVESLEVGEGLVIPVDCKKRFDAADKLDKSKYKVENKDKYSKVVIRIKESSIPVVDEIMRNMSDDHNLGIIRDALKAYGYAGNVVDDAIMRDPFSAENTAIIRGALEEFLVEDEPVAESKVWALAQTSLRESDIMRFA